MESQKINRLKVVLVENGKTGKWLAEQVGKNEATISRWCSNKMQPSLDMLVKIAGLLNVDPRQLINGGNNYGKEESYKERGELPQS
ncbi:helix-turn-helix transcriptional regulator [Phocaeicola vulgatus]|uniref:helix-turn-helix transcriptional regulator n=1 Tax=Phocaeicola vulgatus TaxID=821 RepID=UPI000E4CA059|nr:helix-turn-helix transcriptional regulator [Phocaeicola vulgatus]RHL98823.1 XRE family transcriptional regulator [Phocaeicola vulgatus]